MHCRILVPLDTSRCARHGLEEAIAVAADQQARLCLLHVLEEPPGELGRPLPGHDASKLLAAARRAAAEAGVDADTALRQAPKALVGQAICEEAEREGCDLIVMGARGAGQAPELGRCAESVLREAPVPVMLVREDGAGRRAALPPRGAAPRCSPVERPEGRAGLRRQQGGPDTCTRSRPARLAS